MLSHLSSLPYKASYCLQSYYINLDALNHPLSCWFETLVLLALDLNLPPTLD